MAISNLFHFAARLLSNLIILMIWNNKDYLYITRCVFNAQWSLNINIHHMKKKQKQLIKCKFLKQMLTVTRYTNQLFANKAILFAILIQNFDLLLFFFCLFVHVQFLHQFKWLFNWDQLKEIMRLFSKWCWVWLKYCNCNLYIIRHTCTINHILCVVLNSSIELNTSLYIVFLMNEFSLCYFKV